MKDRIFWSYVIIYASILIAVVLYCILPIHNKESTGFFKCLEYTPKTICYTKDIDIRITSYQPTVEQCDSSPFITASGDSIVDESYYTWCAVSRDLLYWYVNFGDTIVVDVSECVDYEKPIMEFIVKDIVSGSRHIDVLCRIGIPISSMYQGKGKIIGIKRKK